MVTRARRLPSCGAHCSSARASSADGGAPCCIVSAHTLVVKAVARTLA